jgi:hypothetical protein
MERLRDERIRCPDSKAIEDFEQCFRQNGFVSPLLLFALAQWRKEPAIEIEDAYKWLYHATLGGEHAVSDDDGPRAWLDREWPILGKPRRAEPLVTKLRPDGKVIRINLRRYRANGGDREMLLAIFVTSASQFHASRQSFRVEWDALGRELRTRRHGKLTFPAWERLDAGTRPRGFPAIDHSAGYERACQPAYRVVLGSLWIPDTIRR